MFFCLKKKISYKTKIVKEQKILNFINYQLLSDTKKYKNFNIRELSLCFDLNNQNIDLNFVISLLVTSLCWKLCFPYMNGH